MIKFYGVKQRAYVKSYGKRYGWKYFLIKSYTATFATVLGISTHNPGEFSLTRSEKSEILASSSKLLECV